MLTCHIWCPIYEMSITIRCLLKWDDFTTVKKKFGGHILFVISVFSINLHNSVLSTHKATQDSQPGYQQRNNEGREYDHQFGSDHFWFESLIFAILWVSVNVISVPKRQNPVQLIFGKNELEAFLESLRPPLSIAYPTMAMTNLQRPLIEAQSF